jgi:hypothetical protein
MTFDEYLKDINKRYVTGIAREHAYRPSLQNLIESILPNVLATNDPARIECGAPDFILSRNKIDVGYIEAKDIGNDLDKTEKGEQVKPPGETRPPSMSAEAIKARRLRRAECDTVIIPAREEGFKRVFLGEDQWYEIRIGAAMKDRIKYIAAYQVAPVSAVTHIAEVKEIRPYKDTGKYILIFKGPAREINPIKIKDGKFSPQGPVYAKQEVLLNASHLEEALS